MERKIRILTLLTILGVFITACKKDEAKPTLIATSIELVSGNNQTAQVLETLANAVIVIVKDQNGDAFAGADVSFTVNEGSVSATAVTTDVNGNASISWTLGVTEGTQTLNITASDLTGSPLTLNAVATKPSPVTDIDGNTYNVVLIGEQIWMAENLKVTHYADGTNIGVGEITDDATWGNLGDNNTDKAYCFYNNNASDEKDIYGALYTYAAATNGDNDGETQGVCPTGWHLPTDAEWTTLIDELGENAASKLAGNATLWENGVLESNENFGTSNFSALPSGRRYRSYWTFGPSFLRLGTRGVWWSASEHSSNEAYVRFIQNDYTTVIREYYEKSWGYSVRCVKD